MRSLVPISSLMSALWTTALIVVSIAVGGIVGQNADALFAAIELPSFLSIPLDHQGEAPIIRTLAGVLAGFLFFFLVGYLLQAAVDSIRLGLVIRDLNIAADQGEFNRRDPHPAERSWWYYPLFTRLWQDFAETLHAQPLPETPEEEGDGPEEDKEAGEEPPPLEGFDDEADAAQERVQYRSTTSAEAFFNSQALVDIPMRVEFFRHLPGILTGAGIVSTFAGILMGLTEFNPTVDASEVSLQLKNLFTGVSTAFVASFFAIFAAIVLTVAEKLILQWRYGQVAFLDNHLDDLFKGGVEQEYLADLARSGWESADHLEAFTNKLVDRFAAALKMELTPASPTTPPSPIVVEEAASPGEVSEEALGRISERMAERLREGQEHLAVRLAADRGEMASQVSDGIAASLEGPLRDVSESLRSRDLAAEVQRGVEASLAEPLREVAGSLRDAPDPVQLVEGLKESVAAGLADPLRELAENVREAADRQVAALEFLGRSLEKMAPPVDEGLEAVEHAVQRVEDAVTGGLAGLESHLGEALEATRETVVESVRVDDDQPESQVEPLLTSLGESVRRMEGALVAVRKQSDGGFGEVTRELQAQTGGVESLGAQLERLIEAQTSGAEGLGAKLEKVADAQSGGAEGLAGKLERLIDAQSGGSEGLGTKLERLIEVQSGGAEGLGAKLERLIEAHSGGVEGLGAKLEKMIEAQVEGSDRLGLGLKTLLKGLLETQNDGMGRLSDGLAAQADKSEEAAGRITRAIETLNQDQGERVGELMTGLIANRESIAGSAVQVIDALKDLGDSRSAADQAQEKALRETFEAGRDAMMEKVSGLEGRMGEALSSGLEEPLAEIRAGVDGVRAETERQGREINEALLNAFTTQMGEVAAKLAGALTGVNERIQEERSALESSFDRMVAGLGEAAKEGGEKMGEQMESALSRAETRQDDMIDALSQFTVEMRQDITDLQKRMRETSSDAAETLKKHAESLAEENRTVSGERLEKASAAMVEDLKSALDALGKAREEMDITRDRVLTEKLEAGDERLEGRLRESLTEGLAKSVEVMADSVRAAGASQTKHTREMADLLLTAMAGKVDDTFGGLTQGLETLQERFSNERKAIRDSLEKWLGELSEASRSDAQEIGDRLKEAVAQSERRHQGVMKELDAFGRALAVDLEEMEKGLSKQNEEKARELADHVEGVVGEAGKEHGQFLDVLGKRLDLIRKRLKVK